MNRSLRDVGIWVFAALFAGCGAWGDERGSAPAATSPPSLLLLMADDLGRGDVGFLGGSSPTPALDRLAREGVVLDSFHATPLCSPTRAAVLTGRSPGRLGLLSAIRPWESRGLDPALYTLPERLRDAGYATALVGKWHLGHARRAWWPSAHGFEHFYGSLGGTIDYFSRARRGSLDWQRNGASLSERGYATDLVADEALRWLRALEPERPFLLYVSFHAPHSPLQAPDERIRRQAPGPRKRQVLAAMVEVMDDAIAALLDELVRSGRDRNTLVVFLADNGAGWQGSSGGLRGGKGTSYEGGLRVPAVMRWSGHLPAGRTSGQRISAEDLLPTVLDALDLPIDGKDDLDGSSLWPEILEGRERARGPLFVAADSRQGRSRALLDRTWKLVQRFDEARGSWRSELFDIEEDPGEERDLAARNPAVAAALEARLERWFVQDLGAPARRPPEPPADWSPPSDWAKAASP